jgi:hypothetical protein
MNAVRVNDYKLLCNSSCDLELSGFPYKADNIMNRTNFVIRVVRQGAAIDENEVWYAI